MRAKPLTFALLTLSLAAAGRHAAHADATTEAQLRAALQQSTSQIASLEDQVANLQASQAPEVATIEALRAQLKTLQGNGGGTQQNAKADAAAAAKARKLAAALARSQAAYQAAATAGNAAATENASLKAQLAAANAGISSCQAKNDRLYNLSNQILDAYSHKDDVLSTFANHEPFVGFSRVQLQNIVQDDQDTLDANHITPGGTNP